MLDTVQFFKALADETRLRILNLLVRGELCVCDIMKILAIGQSKASRHLAYLKNAGLVTDRREGLWMHYSLARPHGVLHRQVMEWLEGTEDRIPSVAADVRALDDLRRHGELCVQLPLSERNEARPPATMART